jgi:agmatine/peptidylarginine deiminase
MRTRALCLLTIALFLGCSQPQLGQDQQQSTAGSGSDPGGGSGSDPGGGSGSDPGGGSGSDPGGGSGSDPGGGSGSDPGGDPVLIDVDPPMVSQPPDGYPDDDLQCSVATTPSLGSPLDSPWACGACDTDETGQVIDPYCDSYGPPEPGPSSICQDETQTGDPFVSCEGPDRDTPKTYRLPSEHTRTIREIFYSYPVSDRDGFATLPAASSGLLPPPVQGDRRERISQASVRNFILRSMTAATGKRTTDNADQDRPETDLVQVTVVTNNVNAARADIITHLRRTRAQGGLALTQEQAEAMVGNATNADYRGAGKIRLLSVPGLESVWMRDFGPHIVQLRTGGAANAEQVILDFGYHGDRPGDDAVPSRIYAARATLWPGATVSIIDANRGDAQIRSGGKVTDWTADASAGATNGLKEEGGNLHSDGGGSCLTTWKNLAPDTDGNGDAGGFNGYHIANGRMTPAQQKTRLFKLLGCNHVTVLPRLPYDYNLGSGVGTGDGTGHVDMLAHYYGRDKVLLAQSRLGDDGCAGYPDTYIGRFNRRTCEALKAAKKELLDVGYREADIKRIPILDYTTALRAARSTTNIMEVGNRVLYVTYDTMTAAEKTALRTTLAAAYGTRQLFELDATDIIKIGGAVHCTTIGFQDL